MKKIKALAALLLFLTTTVPTLIAENRLVPSFSDYGIENIGIFTEAYPDARSDNYVFEVAAIRANGIIQDPRFFRYRYSNYDLVTPPLTTPEYPLHSTPLGGLSILLQNKIMHFLQDKGWQTAQIVDFSDGDLTSLLKHAADSGLDSVLIVRYTAILYTLPMDNYIEKPLAGKYSADIGKIRKGMGIFPAIELYDTATGNRLWYSAYHAGHQNILKKQSYQETVDAADSFFAHTDKDANIKAVDIMINKTLGSIDAPFPSAADSGSRIVTDSPTDRTGHLFWTDYPSYGFYGNEWGIGYSLDYIGDYNLYYKDTYEEGSPEENPTELAGTIANAVMHKINVPFLSVASHNLAVEPSVFFGIMFPTYATVGYTDLQKYKTLSVTNEYAQTSITSIGFDLSLKYFLRFSDSFSAYIGGAGSIATWWQDINLTYTPEDAAGFIGNWSGLYTNYDANLIVNASIIAGVKWESTMPFELFGSVTPVGPGGKMMLSAGVKFIPFTYGFIEPHATNVCDSTKGF